MNPYASPLPVDSRESPLPGGVAGEWTLWRVLAFAAFLFARIGSSIFATMIALVSFSGTSVNWQNVVPILAGLALLLFTVHVIEWRLSRNAIKRTRALIFRAAYFSYVFGACIALVLGLFRCFPTPFS